MFEGESMVIPWLMMVGFMVNYRVDNQPTHNGGAELITKGLMHHGLMVDVHNPGQGGSTPKS